jgi:hypothetical protein
MEPCGQPAPEAGQSDDKEKAVKRCEGNRAVGIFHQINFCGISPRVDSGRWFVALIDALSFRNKNLVRMMSCG